MNTANNSEYVLDTLVHSVPEGLPIQARIIILMAKGKENTFGSVPNGWDMKEIVAQIVLEYGEIYERLARKIIAHMMYDKSYGEGKTQWGLILDQMYNEV